ncbi:hypothetical protein LWI28_027056 [Acer negundo]|uniref:Uncharacterized protein n=1 Tax=Acer negundo TaxID=4023 RepID=A0AAD5IRQ0_ACENE|nr:hypothetical protein LWI28_027056 [Acer negundo]
MVVNSLSDSFDQFKLEYTLQGLMQDVQNPEKILMKAKVKRFIRLFHNHPCAEEVTVCNPKKDTNSVFGGPNKAEERERSERRQEWPKAIGGLSREGHEVLNTTRGLDSQARKSWLGKKVRITRQEVLTRVGKTRIVKQEVMARIMRLSRSMSASDRELATILGTLTPFFLLYHDFHWSIGHPGFGIPVDVVAWYRGDIVARYLIYVEAEYLVHISDSISLSLPRRDKEVYNSFVGTLLIHAAAFECGVRLPFHPTLRRALVALRLAPLKISLGFWKQLTSFLVLWKEQCEKDDLEREPSFEELRYVFQVAYIAPGPE